MLPFDEAIEEEMLEYFVEVPDDATDVHTVRPVEFVRPDPPLVRKGGFGSS